ncbi:hypothetical protein SAMN05518672_1182 [Chitinophaga sp. CF118]|uniref:hypothetical protein n=1 Tax=Chitinophaga sp. CF118 TaxID=1884367 RepID=UPI0008E0624C|nr:hypothetical protein [Chitinophaga sp. CF118]SFF11439.1 hypothetical protein SAMN05518672_1182 [Chitinophaga sp. CF118]
MRNSFWIVLICLFNSIHIVQAQNISVRRANYDTAFMVIKKLIENNAPQGFKKAVFIAENVYADLQLDYFKFDNNIYHLSLLCQKWEAANPIKNYNYPDSNNLKINYAIYNVMKDTIRMMVGDIPEIINYPYTYNFNDFFGHQDWSNMFVSKLLVTHKGNCHSLPYLYKILADELDASCWLALAPNHIYIKNRCKKSGWYNTELTSGGFPIDAWIMGSGYIPLEAVQNGIYMDTLSNQQAIALCMLDLAKGYEHEIRNYEDGFILRCCDLSLQYFPLNIQAMLLKAETLKRIYTRQKEDKQNKAPETYAQMEGIYVRLTELGYREMPEKMYLDWLQSVNKEKYSDQSMQTGRKPK